MKVKFLCRSLNEITVDLLVLIENIKTEYPILILQELQCISRQKGSDTNKTRKILGVVILIPYLQNLEDADM